MIRSFDDSGHPAPFQETLGRRAGWARSLMPLRRLDRIYLNAVRNPAANVFAGVLRELDVEYTVSDADLASIPRTGPTIVFANHPFGMLDGLLLGAMLLQVRPDVKLLANQLLACMDEVAKHCVLVDNMMSDGHAAVNRRGIREAIDWVKKGGLLIVFPSGEVAHWSLQQRKTVEPAWNQNMARIARLTGATCVPAFIAGKNSVGFHLAGLVHPRLRTLFLPHELINKRGARVEIRVGSPLETEVIAAINRDDDSTELLRWNTSLLAKRTSGKSVKERLVPSSWKPKRPIAKEIDRSTLSREFAELPSECLVESAGKMRVYALTSQQAPNVVREVGRLREITFRAAGEGTGKPRDLDRFDTYYTHLVLWNAETDEIAGAYRLGNVQRILRRYGMRGLYTTTLFRFRPEFFETIPPALELGRSFIRPEYQRQYAPLLLLWKGIGSYIVRHPATPILFGAVSISAEYTAASREVLANFLSAHSAERELLTMLSPKNPPRVSSPAVRTDDLFQRIFSMDDISEWIGRLESDGKGVPVLVRHYMKLGGKFLGFNVDEKFSNVLDGLLMVDLREASLSLLERYLGKSGAREFVAYHEDESVTRESNELELV